MLAVCLCLTASGCGQSGPAAKLQDYAWRLSNVLDVPIVVEAIEPLPQYPKSRQLTFDIPPQKINLLQFLRLSQCELQRLLGERNSNLGRLMSASQELRYQHQFITLAERCLVHLEAQADGEDLRASLHKALANKRQYLPQLMWNAVSAGPEFQHLLGGASQPLPLTASMPSELLAGLDQLLFQVQLGQEAEWRDIEKQLQVIGSEAYSAKLLLAQSELTQVLGAVTAALQAVVTENSLCPRGRATASAKILENVFYKYYIGQVQPYLANVHQQSQALQRRLSGFQQVFSPIAPTEFELFWHRTWSLDDHSIWQVFQNQSQAHTAAWQAVLKSCGMMPS